MVAPTGAHGFDAPGQGIVEAFIARGRHLIQRHKEHVANRGERHSGDVSCYSNIKAFEAVDEEIFLARGLSKNPLTILEAVVFVPSAGPDINTKIERDWSKVTAGF